ncbi:uncharacterized protein LOC18445888 isoform X2 [Amborella trichopoda]|uniref:Carbohydrate kinase PfkB domain-containing protein n=1 Tax=Amborella trichopoda TaxID=13333 RepID=U5DAY3_AMBTC|nr:uncharacterized protein LOC18445888 isoform X2 [Amborella trichopoda]ERN17543.1 hypothetical protein AMTR_s00059p00112290 [Amborella trichopoda]|eukprot:XP_011627693.2 uncharacterized protein LOC18445888 isoform X2 [Amborella trichopoda]
METAIQRRLRCISEHLKPPNTLLNPLRIRCSSDVENPVDGVHGACPVVIGGMVLDIHAKPSVSVNPGTTTPGQIRYVRGGVARNVAECMSKLGSRPFIISVVGNDMAGDSMLEHWKSLGLSIEGIRRCSDIVTPIVSNIFDLGGELSAAVADVEAVEKSLTPDWIWKFKHKISSAPVLMVDGNLGPLALEAACQVAADSRTPVWFEPVSVAKSVRIGSIIKHVAYTSPNEDELIAMANALCSDPGSSPIQGMSKKGSHKSIDSMVCMLKPAIAWLLERGVDMVIVTLGSNGVLLCSREAPDFSRVTAHNARFSSFERELYDLVISNLVSNRQFGNIKSVKSNHRSGVPYLFHFPALPASVVSLTGAGDCLVGGCLSSLCMGLNITSSIAIGIAVAKAAVESQYNIPPGFSICTVADDANRVFCAVKAVEAG